MILKLWPLRRPPVLFACVVALFMISGCSLTLPGAVALDEARARSAARVSPTEDHLIELGARVKVLLTDGTSIQGIYRGPNSEKSPSDELLLQVDGKEHPVPVAEVVWLRPHKRSDVWMALLMGAVIDAAVVYWISGTSFPAGLNF